MEYFLEPITEHDTKAHILTYRVPSPSNKNDLWLCEVESWINHTDSRKLRDTSLIDQTCSFVFSLSRIDRAGRQHRTRRSVIRERFIETLLVADASVTEFFDHPHVTELYLLTMMNMVNSIYRHVSLGYPVEIVLTRIILLNNQVKERRTSV